MNKSTKPAVEIKPFDVGNLPAGVCVITHPKQAIEAVKNSQADIVLVNAKAMVALLSDEQRAVLQRRLLMQGKFWSVLCNSLASQGAPTHNTTVGALKILAPAPADSENRKGKKRLFMGIHLDPEGAVNTAVRKYGPSTVFLEPRISRARYGVMIGKHGSTVRAEMSDGEDSHPIRGAVRDVVNGDVSLHSVPKGYFPIFAAGRVGHAEPAQLIDSTEGFTRPAGGDAPVNTPLYLASYRPL